MTSSVFNRAAMNRLRAAVERRQEEILEGARRVMAEAVETGAVKTQDYLEDAVTRTGLHREQIRGGLPGRHLTGNMVADVNYEDTAFEVEGDVEVYAFGWFPGHFQDYYREQDVGEGNIPAARALERAAADAKAVVRQRMPKAVAGR